MNLCNIIGIPVLNLSVTLRFVYILLFYIKQAESMHVVIIGAGAAGLNAIRYCIDPKYPNITCDVYEQTNHVGGTWYYTDQVDIDRDGIPVHTSMYENLRTNIPKETMNFIDFPFSNYDESFISQKQVYDYLLAYVEHFGLRKYIQFHKQVTNVSPLDNNRWKVTVRDLLSKEEKTLEYDAVIVCNGHYSKPNYPNLPGEKSFKGRIIHSHNFRNAKPYENQTVLVLGAGSSGKDIGNIVATVAKKVYVSHKGEKLDPSYFPENVEDVAAAIQIFEDGVILSDNRSVLVDSIIYCTGYLYDFPFLSKECKIKYDENCVVPLYKQIINIEFPTMAFIGLPLAVLPFPLFDFQNRYFLNYLNGTISLPNNKEMYESFEVDFEKQFKKWGKKKYLHFLGVALEKEYFEDLATSGLLKPLPPVYINLHGYIKDLVHFRHLKFKVVDDENFVEV